MEGRRACYACGQKGHLKWDCLSWEGEQAASPQAETGANPGAIPLGEGTQAVANLLGLWATGPHMGEVPRPNAGGPHESQQEDRTPNGP